jgi:hypothetical protein
MDKKTYSLCEVLADLAFNAGHDHGKGVWTPRPDSRELMRQLIEWAEEFERENADREWDGEYMGAVEDFYRKKIEQYDTPHN